MIKILNKTVDYICDNDTSEDGMHLGLLVYLHVQALLGLSGLILGAIAYNSVAVWQVEVECDQRAMLHAQSPQGRAVDL